MPYLKPLPKEIFDRLKEDIEKTKINEELISKCKDIMKKLLEERTRRTEGTKEDNL